MTAEEKAKELVGKFWIYNVAGSLTPVFEQVW